MGFGVTQLYLQIKESVEPVRQPLFLNYNFVLNIPVMIYGRWDSLPSGTQITPTKLEMRNNRFWPSRHYP